MAFQTTAQLTSAIQKYYTRTLLSRSLPLLLHGRWGQDRPLPQGNGKQIQFRRYESFAPATTPLAEAVTPDGGSLSFTDIFAEVNQYGHWLGLSDRVQLENPDRILTETTQLLGEQQGLTMDTLMRDIMCGGSNRLLAGGVAARTDVVAKITASELERIILRLKKALCAPITKLVNASTGVDTHPIRPAYIALVSPETTRDLEAITGFVTPEKYASTGGLMEGEVGSFKMIRFVETTNAKVFAGGGGTPGAGVATTGGKADVHATLVFGKEAYGKVPLSGSNSGVIIKSHRGGNGTEDTSDPLNQRTTLGWKTIWGGIVIDDSRLVRYEHAVSAA